MKKLILLPLLLFVSSMAFGQAPTGCNVVTPGSQPDYFGCYPNYATSPLLQKFVDALPVPPIATADTTTYPGADYYVIALVQYSQKMHSSLPPTTLRGYVQLPSNATGCSATPVAPPSYLGPVIVATRDKPVRVKFYNCLPSGAGGNLFIPTDTTYMGAGNGPTGQPYTQNRATLHLHGGVTPWISDGTPHQWITPAAETTAYPKGVSVQNVPDMGTDCNPSKSGCQTFFYTNQQSARLMFYHDHAYGITRLNVYAGEAAGYLLTDTVEQTLINGGTIGAVNVPAGTLPGGVTPLGTPLVIQDKTFVPDNTTPYTNLIGTWGSQLQAQDPTWDTAKWGGPGQLWFPHVYMPNQNPGDLSGANPMGRWDYGPWFWPPFTGLQFGEIPNLYFDPNCVSSPTTYCEGPNIPGTPDARGLSPSGVPEAFMDTPVVNGMAYPILNVPAGPVRFRILNAANDRFLNLSLWLAASKNSPTTAGTAGAVMCDGSVLVSDCTEVKMVPFDSTQNAAAPFPSWWYDSSVPNPFDDRVGGVPDPATRGPAMIQIGTEGGFLPSPAVVRNQPVNYVMNKRDITVGNVKEHALFLGPAERADVIVDFTPFAGMTLILYNDSPAPVPAADPRLDYFTGDPDQSDTGGAPATLPGFGPNTRTVMQIVVGGSGGTGGIDYVNSTLLSKLQSAIPAAFAASQDTIVVPQAPYNTAYNGSFPGDASAYVKIQDTSFSFTPIGESTPLTFDLQPKAIIEDFQMDYGRMNAILGNEVPHTNVTNQTSIIQAYVDPPVELVRISDRTTFIGAADDGTQLWKITHNGVDTHAIHFHLFNVQVIDRIGWDGAIKPPEPNELGWKDTVRMNPLEDVVVALRPIKLTNVPFPLPDSIRPLNVTMPLGDTTGFTNVGPDGNPTTVTNELTNFGWEYVYHCHLLGHEENDMMRPVAVAVPPETPSNLLATLTGNGNNKSVKLTWVDNSLSATAFTIERATNNTFTSNLVSFPLGKVTTYTDPIGNTTQAYFYRVYASKTVGSTVASYPTLTVTSGYSNTAAVNLPQPPAAPTNLVPTLQSGPQILLTWTDNATNETGFVLERSANGGAYTQIAAPGPRTNTGSVSYTDTTVQAGNSYQYRVAAVNAAGTSAYAYSAVVAVPTIPLAPTLLTATAARQGNNDRVTLTWSAVNNATSYTIQRATNSTFTTGVTNINAGNTTSYVDTVARGTPGATTYWYHVQAVNASGTSAFSNTLSIVTQ